MTSLTLTPSPRKGRKPVGRSAELTAAPTAGGPGLLSLTVGGLRRDYFLWPVASDFGRAFRLERFASQSDAETEDYHVLLNGGESLCSCKGFLRHGMGKAGDGCKHIASLASLARKGLI